MMNGANPKSSARWDFKTNRLVNCGPAHAWRAFCLLTGWPEDEMPREFKAALKPLGFPVLARARVVEHRPPELVRWEVTWRGLTSRQTFEFVAEEGATRVSFREELSGWNLIPFRLLFSPRGLSEGGEKWLALLAEKAEGSSG